MAALIIQIDARHGRSTTLYRSSGDVMTVGRSFKNDVVLSDLYVDSDQVIFRWLSNHWIMTVLDNTNPVFLNGQQVEKSSCQFQSGDKLVIGRTHITVFMDDHEVHSTRKLLLTKGIRPTSIRPVVALIMVAVMCLIIGVAQIQELEKVFKWKLLAPEILITIVLLVLWAGAWALAGRLLKHEQYFFPQLFFTSIVYTILVFLDSVGSYLEYALNSGTIGLVFEWGLYLVILTVMLKFNLFLATNLKKITSTALFVSTSILLMIYFVISYNKDDFNRVPVYSKVLKPPFTKIARNQTLDEFLNETDTLFMKLKEDIGGDASQGSTTR